MKTINTFIECPHCGKIQSDDYLLHRYIDIWDLPKYEGDTSMECENCKKKFWINAYYIPQYETFKTEEEFEELR